MIPENLSIVYTSDGSATVFDSQFGENFHSTFGAVAESMHVFIKNGVALVNKKEIKILEIGFGTGLNCLLTVINKQSNQKITYHSIEKFPLTSDLISNLNYSQHLNIDPGIFDKIIKLEWEVEKEIFKDVFLKKMNVDLLNFLPSETYDLIYFDAFSPNVQPDLWTAEIFSKMFSCLNVDGILTTYSAKGDVKRAMRSAGFYVYRIEGPTGKRHILRAEKNAESL